MAQQYDADWTDAAKRYQSTVGIVSADAAGELVHMANALVPFTTNSSTLDIGCGPGAVTLALLAQTDTKLVEAIDTSPKMLEDLVTNVNKAGFAASRLHCRAVDIHDLVATYGAPAAFSHVFASFVLHIATKDFTGRVQDVFRVLPSGSVFGIANFTPHTEPYLIWDRVCRIYNPHYVQASYAVDPRTWASPGQIAAGMQLTGFVDIKCVLRRAPFPLRTADAWTDFWFGGKNPAAEAVVRPFFEAHKLTVEEVKETFKRIVENEWEGGKNVLVEYVLAVGRKP